MLIRLLLIALALCLAACATTPPIDLTAADKTVTPDGAFANTEAVRGKRVAWGGMIVNTRNLKNVTEIEVLAYPLDGNSKPDRSAAPQRRFLLVRDGYLESADFRASRLITAVGTVNGTRNGMVGEAPYVYPALLAEQIHLWPAEEDVRRSNPNVHFGIGVGVIFGR